MPTVAETIVTAIAELGVRQVWGVVGDALNPVTDAIRREERLEWIGVRHEEVGAFAAGAQAQLTGRLGVCMGTVGPGSLHLLNGLYDAKKSRARHLRWRAKHPEKWRAMRAAQKRRYYLQFRPNGPRGRTTGSSSRPVAWPSRNSSR